MKLVRSMSLSVVAVALMLGVGCASVQKGKEFNGQGLSAAGQNVSHINAKSSGLYLLSIPLLTGDTDGLGMVPAVMQDTVSVNAVGDLLTKQAKQDGATKVMDLASSRKSVWIVPLIVFFWKDVQMSGNAVK